jgi:hypothetical protein
MKRHLMKLFASENILAGALSALIDEASERLSPFFRVEKHLVRREIDEMETSEETHFASPNSHCSAIKYLSINFHNNMCMNNTFWFRQISPSSLLSVADDDYDERERDAEGHIMCHRSVPLVISLKCLYVRVVCKTSCDRSLKEAHEEGGHRRNNKPFKAIFCVAQQIFL